MLKMKVSLLIMLFFGLSHLIAQEGFSDYEKSYFTRNASSQQREFVNKVTFPTTITVPWVNPPDNCKDEKQAWDVCLRRSFAAFFTESKSYGHNKQVALVYGLFLLGNYDVFNYQSALKKQFNDTAWVENTFVAILPMIKESWYLLDKDTRNIYTGIIKHTDRYLKSFDYQREMKYFNELIIFSRQDEFIQKGSLDGPKNELRKAEAFIFRRIKDAHENNGNWNVKWVQKMIIKLKRGLIIA